MIDDIPRPKVSAERYRDLELIAGQVMNMTSHIDLYELLIIRDICTNMHRRWLADTRLAGHEIAARQGTTLLATDGKIIHLKRDETA